MPLHEASKNKWHKRHVAASIDGARDESLSLPERSNDDIVTYIGK